MAEITTAWVYVPTMNIRSKQMKFEEVRNFCKEHDLGVWDSLTSRVIPIDEYDLKPVRKSLQTYGFFGPGSYLTSPSITLVPFGTTVEFGMFVFPKSIEQ